MRKAPLSGSARALRERTGISQKWPQERWRIRLETCPDLGCANKRPRHPGVLIWPKKRKIEDPGPSSLRWSFTPCRKAIHVFCTHLPVAALSLARVLSLLQNGPSVLQCNEPCLAQHSHHPHMAASELGAEGTSANLAQGPC